MLVTNAGMLALLGRLGQVHTRQQGDDTMVAPVTLRTEHLRATGVPTT